MALNYDTVENWTLDDIAVWLHVVNLDQHIKAFEKAGVTGKILLTIDEIFISSKLKINAPSAQLVLKQAIDQLNGDARRKVLMNKRGSDVGPVLGPTLPLGTAPPTFNRHDKRNQTMPPKLSVSSLPPPPAPLNKSAKELMEYKCKYSGQIKKQGGQHKSWKERFLILSEGCLYYFVNNKAAKAKGSFSIANYHIEDSEAAVKTKFPNSFKMVTNNSKDRTYYFAFDSPHVLQTWKQRIEDEINEIRRVYNTALHQKAMRSPTGQTADIPEDEDDHIYSEPPPDDDDSDDEQNGYARARIADDPDEDPEDPYTQINDNMREIRTLHNGPPINPNLPSFPPRPLHTLPEEEQQQSRIADSAANVSTITPNDPGYLTVREANESRTMGLSMVQRKQSDATTTNGFPPPPARGDPCSDSSSTTDGEEEDPYIQFQTKEDVYPDRAIFDHLSREEANSKLNEEHYDGMYLIRGSSNVDSDKVLSVWTNGRNGKSRHYKVFHDQATQHYSLTSGESYADIPTLLTHYLKNNLPKSEFTLTVPYGYTQQ